MDGEGEATGDALAELVASETSELADWCSAERRPPPVADDPRTRPAVTPAPPIALPISNKHQYFILYSFIVSSFFFMLIFFFFFFLIFFFFFFLTILDVETKYCYQFFYLEPNIGLEKQ